MFEKIISESKWAESHGAESEYLGMGSLYFSIPYTLEAKVCVCLGSGGGFVPKLMYESQKTLVREKKLTRTDVTLVDADIGPWGRPVYDGEIPGYSEIKVIKELTDDAASRFGDIHYLHIDADHSYEQAYRDLCNYGSKMAGVQWAITMHDTCNPPNGDHPKIGAFKAGLQWANENGYGLVNFRVGCGTALIMPQVGW